MIQSTANSICRAARFSSTQMGPVYSTTVNILEFNDSNDIASVALEQSRQPDTMMMCKLEDGMSQRKGAGSVTVHKWPYLRACGPQSNQDIIRVMKNLQPLLQEAIQKKCQTRLWEAPSAVKGPLTWRQFHRLAGRGNNFYTLSVLYKPHTVYRNKRPLRTPTYSFSSSRSREGLVIAFTLRPPALGKFAFGTVLLRQGYSLHRGRPGQRRFTTENSYVLQRVVVVLRDVQAGQAQSHH